MRKIGIVIKGPKVVDVGYRSFLLLNAVKIGIGKVFAYNVDEDVVVRIEGTEEEIDHYVDLIRSTFPPHAKVDGVEVRDFEGEIMKASVFLQFLQLELIEKAVTALLESRERAGR